MFGCDPPRPGKRSSNFALGDTVFRGQMEFVQGQSKLVQIILLARRGRRSPGFASRVRIAGKQKPDQDPMHRDYDQQFDEREPAPRGRSMSDDIDSSAMGVWILTAAIMAAGGE